VNFQLVSVLVNVKWVFVIFQNIFTDIPRQILLKSSIFNQKSLIFCYIFERTFIKITNLLVLIGTEAEYHGIH